MKVLKEDTDIVIPADKGNATVVMDREDSIKKMLEIAESKPFEQIDWCPAKKIEYTINMYLWHIFQTKRITKPFYNHFNTGIRLFPAEILWLGKDT